jgi:hypothetical protein
MACICRTCLKHAAVLGIAETPKSKTAIHKAYRAAAKRWHPDRFEQDEPKRLEAEERFKRIQSAFQELCEHFENPVRRPREAEFVTPVRTQRIPTIFFGDAVGCFTPPDFPEETQRWIAATGLDSTETPVGFVDLFHGRSQISRYILLTNHKMYIRDSTDILGVIWYSDLGEINLTELGREKKAGAWQKIATKIAGRAQRYALRICYLNGKVFRELKEQPDDSIKKVIYNFLLQMKSESQS